MSRDALHIRYAELQGDLNGISPKLPLYNQIKKELLEIEKKLGGKGYSLKKLKDMRIQAK